MNAVYSALFTRLTGYAPLTAQLASHNYGGGMTLPAIYDDVPQAADGAVTSAFPYVRIGAFIRDENDTDTELGFTGTLTIHTWSRGAGMKQAEAIMDAIYDALHFYNLIVTGYGVSTIHQEFAEIMLDSDGKTRHGVQRFRIILEPTS